MSVLPPEQLPFAALVLSSDCTVRQATTQASSLLAHTEYHLTGQPIDILFPREAQMLNHFLADTLQHGITLKAYDQLLHPWGKHSIRTHLYLSPMWEQKDQALLLIDVLQGAERIEQQRNQQEMARRSGLMAAMMAHEVKNPLSSIRGASQLLQEENHESKRLTSLIINEVDRVSAMLERIEFLADQAELSKEPVNIHEVIRYTQSVLDLALQQPITFTERYDPSIPDIMANRDQLVQCLLNLIKNAAEALRETKNPAITLSTSYRHDYRLKMQNQTTLPVHISIQDNGPGIPPETAERLFDPFVTTKKQGNGLGLTIAAKIAANHDGLLELSTTQPGNTRFTLMLPTS